MAQGPERCSQVGLGRGPQIRSRASHTARACPQPPLLKGEPLQRANKHALVPAGKRVAANRDAFWDDEHSELHCVISAQVCDTRNATRVGTVHGELLLSGSRAEVLNLPDAATP